MTEALTPADQSQQAGFQVRLSNFEGPFDLLLQLIFAHRLDVTEVALHQVTDDFIAYTKAIGRQLELDETTTFLVIAATLLDLKAARLLPAGEVHDEEDLACSRCATCCSPGCCSTGRSNTSPRCSPNSKPRRCAAIRDRWRWRSATRSCCPRSCSASTPTAFAQIAAAAFTPRPVPTVGTEHLHEVMVSVPEQIGNLLSLLERRGIGQWASFSELVADCGAPIEIVGRFLALLELYRARAVAFDQSEPLGVLQISWTGERPTNDDLATEDAVEVDADD